MQEVDGGQPVKVLSNVVQFFTGRWLAPYKWSPDGASMVGIWANVNGEIGLYLVSRLGELRKVIPEISYGFTWAPDSRRVAMPSALGFKIVDIATLDEQFVQWEEPYYRIDGIEWSAHRLKYLAVCTADVNSFVLRTVDLDGKTLGLLDESVYVCNPSWNEAGTVLYYHKLQRPDDAAALSFNYELWKVPVDQETGERTQSPQLLHRGLKGWVFTMSPRSNRLVYYSNSFDANLYMYEIPETEQAEN